MTLIDRGPAVGNRHPPRTTPSFSSSGCLNRGRPNGQFHRSAASIARQSPHPQASSCSIVSTLTAITNSSIATARLVLPSVVERTLQGLSFGQEFAAGGVVCGGFVAGSEGHAQQKVGGQGPAGRR